MPFPWEQDEKELNGVINTKPPPIAEKAAPAAASPRFSNLSAYQKHMGGSMGSSIGAFMLGGDYESGHNPQKQERVPVRREVAATGTFLNHSDDSNAPYIRERNTPQVEKYHSTKHLDKSEEPRCAQSGDFYFGFSNGDERRRKFQQSRLGAGEVDDEKEEEEKPRRSARRSGDPDERLPTMC